MLYFIEYKLTQTKGDLSYPSNQAERVTRLPREGWDNHHPKGGLLGEESDGGVGAGGEHPGLRGVKGHVQDAEVMGDGVTSEHFNRDDQRVLEQITGRERELETLSFVTWMCVPHGKLECGRYL